MKSSSHRPAPNDTIYLLEILRFIACIGVILYHYQHFITYRGSQYIPSEIPFEQYFGWFYRNGGSGVQVFWCLSGIIFAHVYQTRIADREISIPQFIWRRFSRLYPLHVLTLLIVAGLIVVLRGATDLTYFTYEFNDMKHLLLNVVFANYWGFQSGTSFNGPVWSVSIELIAYFVFVIIAFSIRLLPLKLHTPIVFLISWSVGYWWAQRQITGPSSFIPTCIALFMVGAIVYTVWTLIPDVVALVLFAYLVADYMRAGAVHTALLKLQLPFTSLMVALLIALIALSNSYGKIELCKSFAIRLGSLTYAMYMIHFPIQFVMVILSESIYLFDFHNQFVFLTFFGLVVGISFICHDRFELPVQRRLRLVFPNSRK
jgi:peptidoglycan/LPS O-acetylase OafA/YrhL